MNPAFDSQGPESIGSWEFAQLKDRVTKAEASVAALLEVVRIQNDWLERHDKLLRAMNGVK